MPDASSRLPRLPTGIPTWPGKRWFNALRASGVRLVGRLVGIADGRLQFSGSLTNQCELSNLKMGRLLDAIDRWARDNDLDDVVEPPQRFAPTRVDGSPPLILDLARAGIRTIVWTTGFRRRRPRSLCPSRRSFPRSGHAGGRLKRCRRDRGAIAPPLPVFAIRPRWLNNSSVGSSETDFDVEA